MHTDSAARRSLSTLLGLLVLSLVTATLTTTLTAATAETAEAASRPGPVYGFKQAKETKHGFKVVWKTAKRARAYQVQVAANRAMKKARRTYVTRHRAKTFAHVRYGRDYFVRVRGVHGHRKGRWSRIVHTGPHWVWNMRATPVSTARTKVSWSHFEDARYYRVRIARDAPQRHVVRNVRTRHVARTVRLGASTPGRTYFYRVLAFRGKKLVKRGALHRLQLKVTKPSHVRVTHPGGHGLTLTWTRSPNAEKYVVKRATNPAMTHGVARYTTTSPAGRFAPPGLHKGHRYYFRVTAANPSSRRTSARASGVMRSGRASVNVGSFNITKDYSRLPWTAKRRNLVAGLINHSGFGVIGLQEAASWENFGQEPYPLWPKIRDTFATTAGPNYYRGRTNKRKHGEDPRVRILWRRKAIDKVRGPRTIRLGHHEYAVAQKLRRGSARFVFVSAHLASGTGRALDDRRSAETKTLIAKVKSFAGGLPVVYAGDFNSNTSKSRTYDAPARVFNARGIPDANRTARRHKHARYNSGNQLRAHPVYRGGHHLDHFYLTPNVATTFWEVVVRLKNANRYRTPFASTHNPIRATVQIPS